MNDIRSLLRELETCVLARTSHRIRGLDIELLPDRVKLYGQTNAFYIKQLAQQGVLEMLPNVRLENAIEVA